ncbi:hypothetical protein [Oceanirhabdus sp. W0125-5]|uniref:hypothetical protein n=1 Tax=Oceanirhabdus sp. W0125-5 TaxID=2999116 RepID=UPI0022F32EAB|nr:hypothetical protein [Oceanirhabdus sp. W0125-5]WBW99535.1 hypothetical protein OW730_12545 [Oceanirhabdus sp. W0125-5]
MAYNLENSLKRVINAITYRDKIVVFSNNDSESILSLSSLLLTLRYLNADVEYLTPNEFTLDGKLTKDYIDNYIKAFGAKLVILIGCDLQSHKENEILRENGIDFIVVKKDAKYYQENYILNEAKMDGYRKERTTEAILVFDIIEGISSYYRTSVFYKYADLIMLAIISSDLAIKDMNRSLIRLGIDKLHNTNNYGIKALFEMNNINEINLSTVQLVIEGVKPSLNALGRMDDSKILVELFTTDNQQRARQIAKYLIKESEQKRTHEKRAY